MAIGSITLTKVYSVGDRKRVHGTFALDNSYPTNGYSLTGSDIGLGLELNNIDVQNKQGLMFEYDFANSKLKVFFPTGGSGTPATGLAVPLTMSGASTASAVNATRPAFSPGVAAEVANGQDLSTATGIRFSATGKGAAAA